MKQKALDGVKVLDLTHHIAGPYCTKLMADYGAEVIKIERPGLGDGARQMGPFYKNDPHPEKSGFFLYLNTNKKGITLNLKSTTGINIFKDLVREADIVVENFRPGVMARLGIGYDSLSEINPELVMTSISNFGQSGPYRDFNSTEIVADAMGGWMHVVGMGVASDICGRLLQLSRGNLEGGSDEETCKSLIRSLQGLHAANDYVALYGNPVASMTYILPPPQ